MIKVRNLTEQDIEIILPHVQQMFLEHDSAEPELFTPNSFSTDAIIKYYQNAIKDEKMTVFVAELNNEIVGTIRCEIKETPAFYKERQVGYTDDLVVFEGNRRKGVGKILKLAAEDWFKQRGIHLLECKIYEWNEASAKLSESLGYKKTFSYFYKKI